MYLEDLYNVFDENVDINVIDSNGRSLAMYDANHIIPDELNQLEVYRVYPIDEHRIDVELYDVDSEDFIVENAINKQGVWDALNKMR